MQCFWLNPCEVFSYLQNLVPRHDITKENVSPFSNWFEGLLESKKIPNKWVLIRFLGQTCTLESWQASELSAVTCMRCQSLANNQISDSKRDQIWIIEAYENNLRQNELILKRDEVAASNRPCRGETWHLKLIENVNNHARFQLTSHTIYSDFHSDCYL